MKIHWNNIFYIVNELHLLESKVSKGYVFKSGSELSWDLNALRNCILSINNQKDGN